MNAPKTKPSRPNTSRTVPFVALAAAALALGSGCIVHNDSTYVPPPEPTGPGDISFQWSFEGDRGCAAAGVEEVDVLVVRGSQTVFAETVECFGGGLTLTDFEPGSYDLLLDAFSRSGRLLFQGDAAARVVGERDNDLGVVTLYSPTPQDGEIALYWSFLYPTDDSEVFACDIAGVDTVHIDLAPLDGQGGGFTGSFGCAEEGMVIDNLPAGDFRLTLEADGEYQGQALVLYDAIVDVTVEGGATTDLADVWMERVYESFADIEVVWDVAGGSCGGLGVDDVTLVITRLDGEIEDDVITLDCAVDFALRETFVPGSYLVEMFGTGIDGDYFGSATRDVAPNSTSDVLVDMVLMP
jgi:hypothetical protein